MNMFKRGINKIKGLFGSKPSVSVDEVKSAEYHENMVQYSDPTYRRSTTATRRFKREANTQYLHESVSLSPELMQLSAVVGDRTALRVHKGEGVTYDVGMNAVKRRAKQLTKRERKAAMRVFRQHLRSVGLGG